MALLCGIDFETTGLDPAKESIIEVGMAVWDTERDGLIKSYSALVRMPQNPDPITPEIEEITGISKALYDAHAISYYEVFSLLHKWAMQCDYLVAHNAEFEKGFLFSSSMMEFLGDIYGNQFALQLKSMSWIDTKTDIPFPERKRLGTLTHMAADHGFLPVMQHRALPDVLTMFHLLSLYDFEEVERYALAPNVTLRISFSYDATGKKNKAARALGYYWNQDAKDWRRPCKEFLADQEIARAEEAGFACHILVPDEDIDQPTLFEVQG